MRKFLIWCGFCTLISLYSRVSFAQAVFEGLYDSPTGSGVVEIRGLSGNGRRVVGVGSANGGGSALYWDVEAGTNPTELPMIPGQSSITGLGISSDGLTIVGQNYGFGTSPAYRWNAATGTNSISPNISGIYDRAYATNIDGSVIVGTRFNPNPTQAFRWTAAGGMTTLNSLPSTQAASDAFGVSGDGQVVVGSSTEDIPDSLYPGGFAHFPRAVSWDETGSPTALPYLPGAGLLASSAFAANYDGSVIVGWSNSRSGKQAARWTTSGVQGLGYLPGTALSTAMSTDALGLIVTGSSGQGSAPTQAFFWSADTGMRPLLDYAISVDSSLATQTAGWTLGNAYISADGTTFAGTATDPSGRQVGYRLSRARGWFVDVAAPEPTSLELLIFVGAGMVILLTFRAVGGVRQARAIS